jgi:hypothetical protein
MIDLHGHSKKYSLLYLDSIASFTEIHIQKTLKLPKYSHSPAANYIQAFSI